MKAVIISDIHLGRFKYGKLNKDSGLDYRTEDILNNIDEAINYSIKNKVEYFFITGDFYHTKRPLDIFRKLLAQKFKRILENKIQLILLLGNHDQGKTSGHDLVELFEVDTLIPNLHVIDKPKIIETEDSLFCLLPHVNKIEFNLKDEEYCKFNIEEIKKFTEIAKKSNKKYKLFFAHFGTDKSQFGNSFDLGSADHSTSNTRFVPLAEFEKIWTRVYLGDIHKHQELNSFCKHIGSIAKVDFGEENETKGFYCFENGKDEFIKVADRDFLTLDVDLEENARERMTEFCNKVQELDLTNSITRLKIRMHERDKTLIKFDGLENYIKENSWNYIGRSLTEIREDKKEIIMNDENINYEKTYLDYLDMIKDKIEVDLFDDVKKQGSQVLQEVLNT